LKQIALAASPLHSSE